MVSFELTGRAYSLALIGRLWMLKVENQGSKFEIPGKSIFDFLKIGNQNFCPVQVMVFDLGYLTTVAPWTQQVRYWK